MIKGQKFNKDAGFSLIELIVVITIIAIMLGGSIAVFGLLGSGDSKKAIKNINSQLADLRTSTLSIAGEWSADIYKQDDDYKIDIKRTLYEEVINPDGSKTIESLETIESSTSIGKKIDISYKDAANVSNIDENYKLVISFEQGKGTIKEVELAPILGGGVVSLIGGSSKNGQIIVTTKSSSISNSLTLWYLTGKLTTDY